MIYFKLDKQEIRFFRSDDRYIITIPSYEGKLSDTYDSIIERFNTKESITLTGLANLILEDSSASPLANLFRLHATNYSFLPSAHRRPFNVNELQAKELARLGWVYERGVNEKISFRPHGKPLENYNSTLSLSFAMNNL